MVVAVGKKIRQFKAPSTSGEFSLNELTQSGNNLVLYFYPKDNTPGCTTESLDFKAKQRQFQESNSVIVGVSRDGIKSHDNFRGKFDLPFDLISDPDEILCEKFGVMKLKNMYGKQVRGIERSTFVIASDRTLIREWRGVKVPGHVDEVLQTCKNI
ncbi:MAG: peroxiredoxin [Burkholderiaceae bacterium]